MTTSHKKNTKKNRMKALYSAVTEAREMGTGRRLCELFMIKPSKKDYPDYYKIILEPVDLRIIDHNIRSEKYMTEDALLEDMKLMFRNARHYNEEGSQVIGQQGSDSGQRSVHTRLFSSNVLVSYL